MPVRRKPSGVVQGTLDMLILKTLHLEPLHGYGIGLRLHQISRGVLDVNAGSLFPAFRRTGARPRTTGAQVLLPHSARPENARARNPRVGSPERGNLPGAARVPR